MITFIKKTVLRKVRLMNLGHLGGNRFFINMGSEELFKTLCLPMLRQGFNVQRSATCGHRNKAAKMRCNAVSHSRDVG